MVWLFKWKLLSSTFLWYCLLCCKRWFSLLSLWMKSYGVTIQMKATEQYFPVVLFIMLCKVVLTFEPVVILWCDHSNKTFFGWTFRWYCCFSAFYENFKSSHRVHLILIKKLCFVKGLDTKRFHLDSQITGYDVIVDSNLQSASYGFYSSYDVPFLPWRILTFTFFP